MMLQVNQISKIYANTVVLNNVSFTVEEGEIVCLLGSSGCGKTTLLRLIAGLETANNGQIIFDHHAMLNVPPHQRGFGLMFQEFALFPHKNVYQNIAFGLEMKQGSKVRLTTKEIEAKVQAMLDLVGLVGFAKRDVSSLSGGEQQRVALARSLAPDPRLLMLDEPLGALDRSLRERLMLEIRAILKRVGVTAIYVTHDQTEAFAVADRIIILNQGKIEQIATPEQLYRQPATPFVAQFLGFSNLLEATCLAHDKIETALGVWTIPKVNYPVGSKLSLVIRPEAASLKPTDDKGILLQGEVVATLFRGRFYQITILVSGKQFSFEMILPHPPIVGCSVALWLKPTAMMLL